MTRGVEVYQFGKKRAAKVTIKPRKQDKVVKKAVPEIQSVQGTMPDSKEEYWVSLALDKLDLSYQFQYPIAGGKTRRGGQMLDFMVYTKPLPTPVAVQGKYWHSGKHEQDTVFNVAKINQQLRGRCMPVVEIWDYELPTPERALVVVRERLT